MVHVYVLAAVYPYYWKRAHISTENHVCFGRIHGSQLREGVNAGQQIPLATDVLG